MDQTAQGKIKPTLEDFQRLVKELPEIRSQMQTLPELVRSSPKLCQLINEPTFYWAAVYDLSFNEQLALLFCALGLADKLHQAAQSDNPTQQVISWIDSEDAFDNEFDNWSGGTGGIFKMEHIIGLAYALQHNVLAIMIFHRSMATLIEEARDGNLPSLFNAIRIDRSVVACPSVAVRISKAEFENDKQFFLHLRSAIKGLSKKHWESYRDLRYSLCLLREMGFDKMSDAQLEDLLVHKLKLYPKTPSARKNIRKQFTESKKFSTTSK
jgi:hypothetical protein